MTLPKELSKLYLLFVACIGLLISGCQTQPDKPQLASETFALPSRWIITGKLSVKVDGKRQSANFSWSQTGEDYKIHLYGPFGQGATWLTKTDAEVTMENAELGIKTADSAEGLMATYLGWQLPIAQMPYWVFGHPAPAPAPTDIAKEEGRLARLNQNEWRVSFLRYHNSDKGQLPDKFKLAHDNVDATVVVKSWSLP